MEEIEYLEEYEDLVLPALNSAAAAASSSSTVTSGQTKSDKISEHRKINDNGGDDSSSSLDQDIFNCLFDDNSDEDDDIEDYNIAYEEQGGELIGQEQKNKINTFDKKTSKITTSTPKPKTFTTKTSNTTTITINRAQSTIANKPKSVATVRPTVQSQLYQSKQKKTNTIQQRTTTSFGQQQHQQRPTTSKAAIASTTSTRAVQLPVLARKPLSSATASTSALVNKANTQPGTSIKTTSGTLKVIKRPATIVKPEKIITKDPVNDPLNLDDLSEAGSDNYSLSDISGETYNTISEFYEEDSNDEYYSGENNEYEDDDDDNISSSSQVIELSNDSSGSRPKLEDLHASTPSPVISDDSDTASNTFDLKLRKDCTTKPYSHAVIIESVLRKGEKPKLLELLKQYNLLDDDSTVDNDHEEEANVVIDISTSKENLSENLETKTVKCKTPDIVENNNKPESNPSTASLPTSSANKDKNKSKKKRLKNMDSSNANRDSTDSDLSAVEELLEESYAEAMKRMKSNQDVVGAELEIAGEEEVTAIEFVKNPELNKPKHNKPGIVIDYEDNPVEERESTKVNESNEMTMEELIEMIEKEQKEKKLKKYGKLKEKPLNRENANTPECNIQLKPKEIVKNEPHTSKEITNKTEGCCSPQKEIMTETLTSKEVTDKPESSCLKQKDTVKDDTNVQIDVTDKSESNTLKSKPNDNESVSTDSPNVRKKKRFRNLNTPEPDIVKSVDDMNDFIGFDDGATPIEFSNMPFVENVTTQEKELETEVVEKSIKKPMEITSKTTTKSDSSSSFKSPTSSHKSLQDKHKETKEKPSRDISKDRTFKESKPMSLSRECSKEKGSIENSKDRSSRESSKERSRESSKDRTKSLHVKDSDKKYYIEHRKSNDSKESSRSRESSKSRDSKHSSDKKDNAADKTKSTGSTDGKNQKDNEIKKKEFRDDRSSIEKKGDTVQYKKHTGDFNKKVPSISAKDSPNLDKLKKESKDSPKVSFKSSASSTSRDSSKDRKDIKKHPESSNKSSGESKKPEIIKKSTESFDKNKSVKAVTTSGTKVDSNKPSVSSTKVSNSNEKHADKFKSPSKSVADFKFDKSSIKPNKDSNNTSKVTPQKTVDPKSSTLKNIKDSSMVKNATPSSSKTITQSLDIKAIKDKSNTSLKVATQKISDAKSKDSNNSNIKVDSIVKTEIPSKSTDKSTTIGANKTPKNVAEDKKVVQKGDTNKNVTSKLTDRVADQNKKTSFADGANKSISKIVDPNKKSSSVANKSLNKIEEPNKKSTPPDTNKSKNTIGQKKEPSNKQTSLEGSKDKKIIPANKLTKEVSGNSSNIKKQKNVVTLNDDVNKSKESPTKLIIKKPIESTHNEKSGDICKKDEIQKQDNKTNIKTITEEQKSKETKSKAQDNKTDKSVSLKPKQEFKPTSDEIKTKVDNEKSKEQPIKTKKLTSVNMSGTSQAEIVDQEAETIEKIEAAVKNTIEKSKANQTTEMEELKQTQKLSANKTDKDSVENIPETKPKTCANEPTKEVVKLETKANTPMAIKQDQGKNTSKETKLQQVDASMTEDSMIETTVTASNVEIKEVQQQSVENISTKKNEIEKPKAMTSKITSKPTEIIANTIEEEPKDVNVTNKSNENCTLQNTSKDAETKEITKDVSIRKRKSKVLSPIVIGESKVNKTEVKEPMKAQKTDELIEDNKDKQDQEEKTEEIIEPKVTRKRMETSKTNESIADIKNSAQGSEVKVNKTEAEEPIKAQQTDELIEDDRDKQNQQEKTEEIIEPRVTRKRMETSKTNESIADIKNSAQGSEVKVNKTEAEEPIKAQQTDELIEDNKDKQNQQEKTEEIIEPRVTRKRMEISKTNESIADIKNSSQGSEVKVNKTEAEEPMKAKQTDELIEDTENKQDHQEKTEEIIEPRVTRKRMETSKTNESIADSKNSSQGCEVKVNKTEADEPKKAQQTYELIEVYKDKQDQQEKTEEVIESRVTRKRMEISKTNESTADSKNSSEGCEVKVSKTEAEEPMKAQKNDELIEDNRGKQEQQEKTEEIIEPRFTRKRMETSKTNENIVDSKIDPQSGEVTSTAVVDIKKNEPIEDNKDNQDQHEKTEEFIEPRVTRKRMETSKTNESIADSKNSSEGCEVKANKTEADEPMKAQKTNVIIEANKDKQDQHKKTEEIIEPRITRKRMEIGKTNENIADSKNSSEGDEVTSNTVDIKKNEPEESKLEPRITRQRVNKEISELRVEKKLAENELEMVEPMKVETKAEDEKSKISESSSNKTETTKQTKEEEMHDIKNEDSKENRADIKSDTKTEETQSVQQPEITSEKDEGSESNIAIRTRKRVVVKTDADKLKTCVDEKETKETTTECAEENNALNAVQTKEHMDVEEEKSAELSLTNKTNETDEKIVDNNFKPIRTRKRVDVKVSGDVKQAEIAKLLKEDKTESKEKIAIEAKEKDNFEPKLTRNRADAKVQESSESTNKDKIDLKAETSDCIVETGKQTEEKNVIKAKNTDNVEPIPTKKRAEEKPENLDKKKIVKSSSGVVDELNTKSEESMEPVKTRKGAEKKKAIGVEAEDHSETISLRKRVVVIVNDIKQNEDAEPSNKDENIEENQAIEDEKGGTTAVTDAEETIDSKCEPIRTRKRADVKADVIEKESTERTNEEKAVSKDQIKEDIIEPLITRKRLEETNAVGIEKNEESTPELIRTRKRAKVKSDDFKKEENNVCGSESKADQTEKQNLESANNKTAVEDNLVEPIRTRSRMELKIDIITTATFSAADTPKKGAEPESTHSNSTLKDDKEHKAEEKNIDQIATSNAAKQSKEQMPEYIKNESEAKIPSNDSPNTLDNTLKRTLRKRGVESPFSENDNKKLFKEPSTKIVFGRTTPKFTVKLERPSTSASVTGLKRSLRSPVSDSESSITAKRMKLETPRKTTRFRNLHDDCLEEEELPVITADTSVSAAELDDLNEQAKEAEDQENISQSPRKSVRKETSQNKNTEPSVDKETTLTNVGGGLEKKKAEKQENDETEVQVENTIETKKSSVGNKTTALNDEKSLNNDKSETKQQNSPDQNKTNKTNTPLNKPSSLSSVLSFSDWLKTKGKSVIVDDNSENNSVQSTSTSEMSTSTAKAKGRGKVKGKPNTNVVETVTAEKTNKQQEGHVGEESQQKEQDVKKQISQEDSLNIDSNANQSDNFSLLQPAQKQIENAIEPPDNTDESSRPNKKRNANTKKAKTKQYKAENSNSPLGNKMSDSKVTMDKSKSSTPMPTTKPKIKKSETDLLIESMSKEMKDGGINDLLNPETHVKRPRLASKRNSKSSTESLNTTSSHVTTKKPTTASTTAGTVLNKEIPKVMDFSDTAEIVSPKAEVIKSPNKRNKTQQNTIKTNKDTASGIEPNVEETAVKSRKSLNLKVLLTHNKAADEAFSVAKSRKSMPQMKILNVEKDSAAIAIENTSTSSQSKARKSVPSSIKEVDSKNSNKIFKAPKPIVHTVLCNLIPNQENIAKLYAEDKRTQNRNKIKPINVLKAYKCRNFKIRLNRSKVKKYLSTQNERKNEKTLETSPTCFTESSSMIQYNADSNLRLQSVVSTADLMDLTPDYNPNNVFVPQDSFIQTSVTPSTLDLDAGLPLSTITPASVAVLAANQPYVATEGLCDTIASLPVINAAADPNEHIELKNEFLDENPIDLVNEALLPDTPTLLARAQTITQAAQNALSNSITPTDIRLLTTETAANAFVPSFGVAPRVLDNKGTCMYTFLHPAKYNRNHSNVLLDYCCPNLDGPMPAIDPTRIHAQVQVPVIELPASIVLTTKVVTRADLERENSNVPAIIRRKAEKIRNNLAAHHKVATAASAVASSSAQQPTPYMPSVTATPELTLPPTINALTKQLPATTTITAKIRPTQHQDSVAQNNIIPNQSTTMPSTLTTIAQAPKNLISVIPKGPPQLNQVQKSSLRSNLRRFDILLKQLVQPFDNLNFVDRQRIIEAIVTSGKILPKDLDRTIVLLEEYIKQSKTFSNNKVINQTSSTTAAISLPPATTAMSTNSYHMTTQPVSTIQMPQLQPSPNMLAATSSASLSSSSAYCRQQLEQLHKKAVKTVQTASKNTTSSTTIKVTSPGGGALVKSRQVPIYDTERNIIGYQMKMVTPMAAIPAFTKSTMSTHTGTIMSTSLDSSNNKITSFGISKRPVKRPAQDSPRVFYTTPPLKTSTPKAITQPTSVYPSLPPNKQNNSKTIAQKTQKGSVVTTLRSAAAAGGSSSTSSGSTITTTTMATVKRVTRSTATGSKIIIVSKSNQSSEETILPDTNNQQQPEIKNEKDIEDFIG